MRYLLWRICCCSIQAQASRRGNGEGLHIYGGYAAARIVSHVFLQEVPMFPAAIDKLSFVADLWAQYFWAWYMSTVFCSEDTHDSVFLLSLLWTSIVAISRERRSSHPFTFLWIECVSLSSLLLVTINSVWINCDFARRFLLLCDQKERECFDIIFSYCLLNKKLSISVLLCMFSVFVYMYV
jgi:hypothetical protein